MPSAWLWSSPDGLMSWPRTTGSCYLPSPAWYLLEVVRKGREIGCESSVVPRAPASSSSPQPSGSHHSTHTSQVSAQTNTPGRGPQSCCRLHTVVAFLPGLPLMPSSDITGVSGAVPQPSPGKDGKESKRGKPLLRIRLAIFCWPLGQGSTSGSSNFVVRGCCL